MSFDAQDRREAIALFVVSASALGVQVVWTRIFSFMIWYHFAFLVISVSMLGFTAGGLALRLSPRLRAEPRAAFLFWSGLAFAVVWPCSCSS